MPLTTIAIIAITILGLQAAAYAALDRVVDDLMLLVGVLVELVLLVLIVITAINQGQVSGQGEGATMLAYALTLPIIPPIVLFIALKEKTRWAMGVVLAGAFTVGVMTYRILQIWQTSGPA